MRNGVSKWDVSVVTDVPDMFTGADMYISFTCRAALREEVENPNLQDFKKLLQKEVNPITTVKHRPGVIIPSGSLLHPYGST